MNYKKAMEYIKKTYNFGSNYGLSRVSRILELLENPQNDLKIIHVAGTNGKGSITSMVASCLIEEGYKVGMYTSPFLEEFEERIQINRQNIEKNKIPKYIERLIPIIDRVYEEGLGHPTEFEIITCMMFQYFKDSKVDYAVVEVGLGGSLDATNVCIPLVEVIASIGLDHMHILGDTIEKIAYEKGGIIKDGSSCVIYPPQKSVREVFEKIGEMRKAKIKFVNLEDIKILDIDKEKFVQVVEFKGELLEYNYKLNLLGEHQVLNSAVAIRTLEEIQKIEGKTFKKIELGLEHAKWNGRLEVLKNKPLVVIDGAHNLDGIKRLDENVDKYFNYKKKYLILGILADKEVDSMIDIICRDYEEIVALTPHSERAELASKLKDRIKLVNENVVSFENYKDGYEYLYSKCRDEDLLLCTGSLYMIGEMRGIIKEK